MTTFNFSALPQGFASQLRQHLSANMRGCTAVIDSRRAGETTCLCGGSAAAGIGNGYPEAGGGGAAAKAGRDTGGTQAAPASDDDDGGDADSEPAKRQARARSVNPLNRQGLQAPQGEALLRIQVVLQRTSLSKSTLYAKIKEGSFPAPVRLGARCSRWKASELDAWLSHVGQ
jgi:prophage regulatory protein